MSYLDQIARAGGQGDGGPPLSTLGFAPTGRASCKGCGGAIPKGGLRATKFVRSAHHDGYDAAHYHAECLKSPPRGFDPRCVLALPWRDQLNFSGDDAQKDALRGNPDAQRASELLSETRKALANDVKPKDVKQLCEENGYALVSGPKPIPLDTLLDEAGASGAAGGRVSVVVTHGGRTAMNVQLVLVDSCVQINHCFGTWTAREANKFYRLQCLNFGERYAVFSRWGRVGQDDGRGVYSAYGGSRANKCMLHFHPTLARPQQEFSHYFNRHTLNDWPVFAATRAFEQKPGCYDVVRHADASSLATTTAGGGAGRSRPGGGPRRPGHQGAEAPRGGARRRRVDVLREARPRRRRRGGAPAARAARRRRRRRSRPRKSVEAFVRCIMDKKNLEDDLSKRDVDVKKFPLGEISLACVKRAYTLGAVGASARRRAERAEATDAARQSDVDRARDAAAVTSATNDFLRAIPHKVGRGAMAALRLDSSGHPGEASTSSRRSSRSSCASASTAPAPRPRRPRRTPATKRAASTTPSAAS
ncbi:hypothetical protein SO694_00002349 [Aureococcus anophagefferens]|uniref:NAD(+) ADP-ribosyltransferase n=1 Tax=Aureococcus anophagefferens TaxID=44056 RepID=A0ABR1GCR6_AURAN